ncbi:MAG TPA: hypothetical protein VHB27_14620 [Rhodopila sp.]|uniref:hypothetical protein n=1 Tax=Rhodopila sp. TaxID=2480087 RepID=UPI002B8A8AB1|nr:hypothetical protein [Rhodopila sp.]HVY16457.1 hypothetical protein [Rhodopila sp.]
MEAIGEVVGKILSAPTGSLLLVAGILFLLIAVVGNISGRIEPGPIGRVAGGVLGAIMVIGGLTIFAVPGPGVTDAQSTKPDAAKRDPAPAPTQPGKTTAAPAPSPALAGRCASYLDDIVSNNRDERVKAQAKLIQQCASDAAAVSLAIDKAQANMGNKAAVYDVLSYLDKVSDSAMSDPALRRKIHDFAVAAAGNSADSAAISSHLQARY